MIEMRENVVPILEDYGVDLAFSGHTHAYERSYFIDGHYGFSSDFGVCEDNDTPADPSDDYCASSPSTPCPNGVIDCDFGGYIVDAGEAVSIQIDNLKKSVWIDCQVAGEGVSWIALVD